MAVPTIVGYSDTVQAGDLLIWQLPADQPGPPGATLHSDGLDEQGQPIRVWWAYAWQPGPTGRPRPYVMRGWVVDDGTGTSTDAFAWRGAIPLDWYALPDPEGTYPPGS